MMDDVELFRDKIQNVYRDSYIPFADFGEILCYEIHSQPINPRMPEELGLTFKELSVKWGISNAFLGQLIEDHCRKL